MNPYTFKIPQTVEFGVGALAKLPSILDELGSEHVFLVSDRMLESIGVVGKVTSIVERAGIDCTCFLEVEPNPTVAIVETAAEAYAASGATSIIALGGGSPMDVAKAVGVLATFGGNITDYEGANKIPDRILPLIAIPTTAGTGSEATASAVITDVERNYKFYCRELQHPPRLRPARSGAHHDRSRRRRGACGVDAFIHAMEAYVSRNASPFTDAVAEKAMQLIGANIRRFVACRQDAEAASAMMVGSNLAGIAFAWARLGNIHAMSHPVSAYFHVAHGVANAVLMPTVVEYNALADNGRYRVIFDAIRGCNDPIERFEPSMLVDELRRLNADLGLPASLSEVGVTEDTFEAMAEDAMKSVNVPANPRQTTKRDIIALYKKAL